MLCFAVPFAAGLACVPTLSLFNCDWMECGLQRAHRATRSGIQCFFTAAGAGWHRGGYSRMPRVNFWVEANPGVARAPGKSGARRKDKVTGGKAGARAIAEAEISFLCMAKTGEGKRASRVENLGGWLGTASAAPARSIGDSPAQGGTRQTRRGAHMKTRHMMVGWGWHRRARAAVK